MVDIEAGGIITDHEHLEVQSSKSNVSASCDVTAPESRRRSIVEDHKKHAVQDPHDVVFHHGADGTHATNKNNNTNTNNNHGNNRRALSPTSLEDAGISAATMNNNNSKGVAPVSGRMQLPLVTVLANKAQKDQKSSEPKLLHPLLSRVPLQFRFGLTGLCSNILFMVVYNTAVDKIPQLQPSVIYALVYFFFIPASHWMVSWFVFGWPEQYLKSLLSNFPIGLTAIALGGLLTAYLDQAGFNRYVAVYVRDNFTFSTMPNRDARITHDEEGEFYSSILVLIVTSLWTFVLSVYVNSPPEKSQKKEL